MSPAGPYPTKQMHEALKARVGTLENAPAGGGGASGTVPRPDERAGVGVVPGAGNPDLDVTGNRLVFRWERRSVAVAGFALQGDIPLSAIAGIHISTGPGSAAPVLPLLSEVTRRLVDGYSHFDFPELPVVTDGEMNVYFDMPITMSGYSNPPPQGTGTSVEMQQDGAAVPGTPDACVTIVRDLELPVRPAYVPRSGADAQARRAEIIWPASGNPYLLVIGVDGSTFHAPLTPGLPQ